MSNPLSRLATRVAYGASQLPRVAWYVGHSIAVRRVSGGRFVHAQSFTGPVLGVFFRSPCNQTAADHKYDQDGKKYRQFQVVRHAYSPSPALRAGSKTPAFALGRGCGTHLAGAS